MEHKDSANIFMGWMYFEKAKKLENVGCAVTTICPSLKKCAWFHTHILNDPSYIITYYSTSFM